MKKIGNEKCKQQNRRRKTTDEPWTTVEVKSRNVYKILRDALPETHLKLGLSLSKLGLLDAAKETRDI